MTAEVDHGLVLNQIGSVTVSTARPIIFDRYVDNRGTGSFILIDPSTNFTSGAGMIAERPGRGASRALRGPLSLAWRLDRGALLLWTVGLCLYGLVMGSVVHGIGDELGGSTVMRDIVARMGGTSALEEAFIAVAFTMMGMVAAAFGHETGDLVVPLAFTTPGRKRVVFTLLTDERVESDPASVDLEVAP